MRIGGSDDPVNLVEIDQNRSPVRDWSFTGRTSRRRVSTNEDLVEIISPGLDEDTDEEFEELVLVDSILRSFAYRWSSVRGPLD